MELLKRIILVVLLIAFAERGYCLDVGSLPFIKSIQYDSHAIAGGTAGDPETYGASVTPANTAIFITGRYGDLVGANASERLIKISNVGTNDIDFLRGAAGAAPSLTLKYMVVEFYQYAIKYISPIQSISIGIGSTSGTDDLPQAVDRTKSLLLDYGSSCDADLADDEAALYALAFTDDDTVNATIQTAPGAGTNYTINYVVVEFYGMVIP